MTTAWAWWHHAERSPMSKRRLGASILLWLLAPGLVGSATAQIAPRPTGAAVIDQLTAHDLTARAAGRLIPASCHQPTPRQRG